MSRIADLPIQVFLWAPFTPRFLSQQTTEFNQRWRLRLGILGLPDFCWIMHGWGDRKRMGVYISQRGTVCVGKKEPPGRKEPLALTWHDKSPWKGAKQSQENENSLITVSVGSRCIPNECRREVCETNFSYDHHLWMSSGKQQLATSVRAVHARLESKEEHTEKGIRIKEKIECRSWGHDTKCYHTTQEQNERRERETRCNRLCSLMSLFSLRGVKTRPEPTKSWMICHSSCETKWKEGREKTSSFSVSSRHEWIWGEIELTVGRQSDKRYYYSGSVPTHHLSALSKDKDKNNKIDKKKTDLLPDPRILFATILASMLTSSFQPPPSLDIRRHDSIVVRVVCFTRFWSKLKQWLTTRR